MADRTLDVEILDTGTHNGVAFTEGDLDTMVANFDALRDHLKPPLKLGHDDAQVLKGQKDGDPALGWVAGLRRAGTKLIATVTDVPARLVELIQKRRYRRVSSEVLLDFAKTPWEKNLATGVRGKALSAVALLGADLPAVASLQDLSTLLATTSDADPVRIDGPTGLLALASDPAGKCPHCGAAMRDDEKVCLQCGKPRHATMASPRITDVKPEQPEKVTMAEDTKLADELAALRAELAKRDESEAVREAERVKMAADLDGLKKAKAEADQRAADAAAEQRVLRADAFVAKYTSAENCRLTTPQAQHVARALYVKLSAQTEPMVAADESVPLKLSADARPWGGIELLEAFVEGLPDQKVLLTSVANPKKPEREDYEALRQRLASEHKIDLSTADGRGQVALIIARDYASKSPEQFGFREKE